MIENYIHRKQDSISEPLGLDKLTEREREVLQLIAEGNENREIAKRLFVSTKTVEAHKHKIQRKLQLHGTAELTKYAILKGLAELDI